MKFLSDGGWKWMCAVTYIVICIFDFVIVPAWIGLTRTPLSEIMQHLPEGDVQVQLEYLRLRSAQHVPFTLQNGGFFHLAFGALLTGSAINRNRNES